MRNYPNSITCPFCDSYAQLVISKYSEYYRCSSCLREMSVELIEKGFYDTKNFIEDDEFMDGKEYYKYYKNKLNEFKNAVKNFKLWNL
jgi:hypothetical protein